MALAVCLTYVLSTLSLCMGLRVTPFQFPAALLASYAIAYSQLADGRSRLRMTLIFLGVTVSAIILSGLIPDYSWDGNVYHQESVALLMEGWNPFYDLSSYQDVQIWVAHYAKGIELAAAAVADTVGRLDAGKAVNLLLVVSPAFLLPAALPLAFPEMSRRGAAWCGLAASLNPIGIAQCFTYYNDFASYYCILLTILFIFLAVRTSSRLYWWSMAAVAVFAVGIKFTAFFEEGLMLLLAIIWFGVRRDKRACGRVFLISAVALMAGVLFAWHPYVTNCLIAGNPFWPLMGTGSEDIMTGNTPGIYSGHGRFVNFLISIFSISLPSNSERIGGFGPFMPILLIISIYILIRYRKTIPAVVFYIAVMAFASCFIYEQAWWARYVSRLWLVPVAAVCSLPWRGNGNSRARAIGVATSAMMVLTALLCIGRGALLAYRVWSARQALITALADTSGVPEARVSGLRPHVERQLAERGIRSREIPYDRIDKRYAVYYFNNAEPQYYPVVQLTERQYAIYIGEGRKMRRRLDLCMTLSGSDGAE